MMVPTTKNGLPLIKNDPPRPGVCHGWAALLKPHYTSTYRSLLCSASVVSAVPTTSSRHSTTLDTLYLAETAKVFPFTLLFWSTSKMRVLVYIAEYHPGPLSACLFWVCVGTFVWIFVTTAVRCTKVDTEGQLGWCTKVPILCGEEEG